MALKSTWINGEVYAATDVNAVATQVNAVSAKTFFVNDYGADPTGAAASDTAVAAAITAMGTGRGTLEFGKGIYRLDSTKTLAYPGQGLCGQGAGATTIDWRGTGDCFRIWDSTVPTDASTTPGKAGPIIGFTLSGVNNANANSNGLHIGDLDYLYIENVFITGLDNTGCIGAWFENRYSWSERGNIEMICESNTNNVVFDKNASHPATSTSFCYSTFKLDCYSAVNQNHVIIRNNTVMLGVNFTMFGGAGTGTTNTGTVLTIGTTGTDQSCLDGHILIALESHGSTAGWVSHKDISTANTTFPTLRGYGELAFEEPVLLFQSGTATSSTVAFAGRVSCPSLGRVAGGLTFPGPRGALRVIGDTWGSRVCDTNGNPVITLGASTSAVNYIDVANAGSGFNPVISAAGSGTNISIVYQPKGSGALALYEATGQTQAVINASGSATNVDLNLGTQGTGGIKVNGAALATAAAAIPAANLPNGITNGNTTAQSQATVSGTAYYIAGSNLALPATLKAGMIVGTRFRWHVAMAKTAAGTGIFEIILYRGTNGSTSDTADVAQTIGTQTAVVDSMVVDVEMVVTTTGATGAYFWSIIPQQAAATATGFGVATGATGQFSGTKSSVALNTASLIFGLGFRSTTGTPTVTVPLVQASAINID